MTAAEAKQKIKEEFIRRFYEWLDDEKNLSEKEFGWKYGWIMKGVQHKDNLTGVVAFQKYGWAGRYLPAWEKEGYPKNVIWQLVREGFLSEDYSCSSRAIREGKTNFDYISQKTAKEILKEWKAASC